MINLPDHPAIKSRWQSHDGRIVLLCGDNRQVLPLLPDCSVDSVVCDPPYELGFMGKKWDNTGIAYDAAMWRECLRVLKPGGHLLAFGGSRTYHRMACAIEDAGFEVRDMIEWIYASGFPKSLDIGKAIDKAAGAERVITGRYVHPHTGKELTPDNMKGSTNPNPMDWGKTDADRFQITSPATPEAKQWDGFGTQLKPSHEPCCLARKPFPGTVANNVLTYGTGAMNIDGCRIESGGVTGSSKSAGQGSGIPASGVPFAGGIVSEAHALGRFPANLIHDGSPEVVNLFPETVGKIGMVGNTGGDNKIYGKFDRQEDRLRGVTDSGSAARFFYCAKADKVDRNEGCEGLEKKNNMRVNAPRESEEAKYSVQSGNNHPTVKPTDLMQYLCRLVTPPGGIVLDPFAGSGSTGKACIREEFQHIGIEMEADHFQISVARCDHESRIPRQIKMTFDAPETKPDAIQETIF